MAHLYSNRFFGILVAFSCALAAAAQDLPLPTEPQDSITDRNHTVAAPYAMREAVFDYYLIGDTLSLDTPLPSASLFPSDAFNWLDDGAISSQLLRQTRQRYMVAYPEQVRYNERLLPEPPRKFRAEVDPLTARLVFYEDSVAQTPPTPQNMTVEVKKRHWMRVFDGLLQFSQSYISPNWYQGGTNNLTLLLNLNYNVKLNQAYHPNLLLEANVSYKFSITAAPKGSLRPYNISEDLLQLNGKAGIKAWHNWFYSLTGQFKTQFFNNYEPDSDVCKAAFLSPAELNLGLGMSWSHDDKKHRISMTASISPLSWNMRACLNDRVDPTTFGIPEGKKVLHDIGSNAEFNFAWQITYNISYVTRIFLFTNYKSLQGDWENTLSFNINKFLSTQLFVHLRYDSLTPKVEGSKWHRWQLRELLSFGLSYNFSTL